MIEYVFGACVFLAFFTFTGVLLLRGWRALRCGSAQPEDVPAHGGPEYVLEETCVSLDSTAPPNDFDAVNLTVLGIEEEIADIESRLEELRHERKILLGIAKKREKLCKMAEQAAQTTENEKTLRAAATAAAMCLTLDKRGAKIDREILKAEKDIAALRLDLLAAL